MVLTSRACNRRVRPRLFARFKVTNLCLEHSEQFPDVLLGYTPVSIIRYLTNPPAILTTLYRFVSSPLIVMSSWSMCAPEELSEKLKLDWRNVRYVKFANCTLIPAVLINLVSTLEHMSGLRLQGCRVGTPLEENDNAFLPYEIACPCGERSGRTMRESRLTMWEWGRRDSDTTRRSPIRRKTR